MNLLGEHGQQKLWMMVLQTLHTVLLFLTLILGSAELLCKLFLMVLSWDVQHRSAALGLTLQALIPWEANNFHEAELNAKSSDFCQLSLQFLIRTASQAEPCQCSAALLWDKGNLSLLSIPWQWKQNNCKSCNTLQRLTRVDWKRAC